VFTALCQHNETTEVAEEGAAIYALAHEETMKMKPPKRVKNVSDANRRKHDDVIVVAAPPRILMPV
jgi:hypothetical protein